MIKINETLKGKDLFNLRIDENYFREENCYVKTYRNSIIFIDLRNAFQARKTVSEYRIQDNNKFSDDVEIEVSDWLSQNNIDLKEFYYMLINDDVPSNFPVEINKSELNSTRVYSPFSELKPIKEPKKWNIGHVKKALLTGQISSGKCDLYLTDDYARDNANNFGRGDINVMELAKKIIERPSGWWVSVDKENDEYIVLSVNCHHFDYNTLVFNKKFKPKKQSNKAAAKKTKSDTRMITKKQKWALHCITKLDTRNLNISLEKADELIKKANQGINIKLQLKNLLTA